MCTVTLKRLASTTSQSTCRPLSCGVLGCVYWALYECLHPLHVIGLVLQFYRVRRVHFAPGTGSALLSLFCSNPYLHRSVFTCFFFSQLNATACLFVFMKSVLAKIFELTGIELIILFKNWNIYVHVHWSILFIQIWSFSFVFIIL